MSDILRNIDADPRNDGNPPALISNGFFNATGANAAAAGFQLHTFTQPGLTDPFPAEQVGVTNPFKGNLDIEKASAFLGVSGDASLVAMLLLTITNNWAGAQPVSMGNIKPAAELAKQHSLPPFFDAWRFAENAKFIQDFEAGYQDRSIPKDCPGDFCVRRRLYHFPREGWPGKYGWCTMFPRPGHLSDKIRPRHWYSPEEETDHVLR